MRRLNLASVIILVLLAIYALSLMVLYLWGFMTSLKSNLQFSQNPYGLPSGAPWQWAWGNYGTAFTTIRVFIETGRRYVHVPEMLLNSLVYAIGGALINNLTLWLVAYLLARFPNRFSKLMYFLNIVLMIVPVLGTLPSALMVYRFFNWYDNWMFIIFNNIAFTGMYLLIYHAFIKGLGGEYAEAAYMDGASNFTVMVKISFPLTSSMFFVILLLLSIARWNDYMTMIIWMPNYPTLAYGLYKISVTTVTEASFPPIQIAACMLLMLPMLVLFFIFQKPIMGELRLGGLKA